MISIDASIIVQIVMMLILMVVLNGLLYKPIRRLLEERESRMSDIREQIESYERNAQQLVDNFNKRLAEARMAGQKERDKFKDEARAEEKRLLEESMAEAQARKEELMSGLGAEIEAARKELKEKAEAFAAEIAQKLLGRAV